MQLPLVPIVQNCAVQPLMPVRRSVRVRPGAGRRRSGPTTGLERVALVGAGGLSHWIGNPRVGDIDEDFDRWFLTGWRSAELDDVLDMPDEEIELAGNGTHEIRSWLAVAGAMAPHTGHPAGVRAGLPVDHRDGRGAMGYGARARGGATVVKGRS